MSPSVIKVADGSASLRVSIASPHFPQALAGVLWRYEPDKTPDGKAGVFTPSALSAPIGGASTFNHYLFLIEGAVLQQGDDPPTPYQVVVSIAADGKVVHEELPTEGGIGTVGSEDVSWVYRFQIEVAS